ncbi:MAG: Esterase/lipase/thioesterase family active site [Rhodoglobus sp.]|nr:Esterase/lipase/thioesterase family active site [Rhodoglobus sp.]
MPANILWNSPQRPRATLVLAHGAGAPMDNGWMNDMAALLAERGIRVARFEFEYMAGRRQGVRRPPPRADTLLGEYRAVVEQLGRQDAPLFIGGKSMGGRVASMIADELHDAGAIAGLVCLGYPFHPPEKPEQVRTAHLLGLRTPTLICQGTRDPFGTREDVAGYLLSDAIGMHWLEDGDHDLRPRKAISGFTFREHLASTADAVAAFATR